MVFNIILNYNSLKKCWTHFLSMLPKWIMKFLVDRVKYLYFLKFLKQKDSLPSNSFNFSFLTFKKPTPETLKCLLYTEFFCGYSPENLKTDGILSVLWFKFIGLKKRFVRVLEKVSSQIVVSAWKLIRCLYKNVKWTFYAKDLLLSFCTIS